MYVSNYRVFLSKISVVFADGRHCLSGRQRLRRWVWGDRII